MLLRLSISYSKRISVLNATTTSSSCRRSTIFRHYSPRNIGAQSSLWRRFQNRAEYFVIPTIITLNIAVYGAWYLSESDRHLRYVMQKNFTLCPRVVVEYRTDLHTIVTSFFSHKDAMHLGFNMLTLYFFGTNAIATLGAARFLGLYMAGGIFSNSVFCSWPYLRWSQRTPMDRLHGSNSRFDRGLGASGAINSIVFWSVCSAPFSIMIINFISMPAAVGGLLFVASDLYGLSNQSDSHIGHISHLSGAALGLAYFLLKRFR